MITHADTAITATGAAACAACAQSVGVSPTVAPILGAIVAIVVHAAIRLGMRWLDGRKAPPAPPAP